MTSTTPARVWLRRNLFRTKVDSAVTILLGGAAVWVVSRLVRFVLFTGRWDIIRTNLKLLLVGRYPTVHLPRVSVSLVIAAAVGGLIAGMIRRRQVAARTAAPGGRRRIIGLLGRFWPLLLGIALLLGLSDSTGPWLTAGGTIAAAVAGRVAGEHLPGRLDPVLVIGALLAPFGLVAYLAGGSGWEGWGGLLLNVFLALASMVLCFPLGVLAALGRRSRLPIVRGVSTIYIELLRGMPLFVLLLMANVALGFFIPADVSPGKVVRAIVVFTLFTGAYLAEIVRGGLQSLPPGQEEAAKALGMTPVTTTFRIVLPQALRNVIPAQVGQLISLFKDTTLAGAAMGLFDLLDVGQVVTRQGDFAGQRLTPETYAFVGLLFWLGSYTMSRESQRIERKLGVGER